MNQSILYKSASAVFSRLLPLFLGLIIAIAIGEAVLRHLGFEWTLYPSKVQFGWPTPNTFQWRYAPDAEFLWVRKDSEQMLKPLQNHDRPSIVFMGDSCTEMGVYVDKFREKLESIDPGRYTVAAIGTGGWSSWQGLRFFEKKIAPLKPKIVAFYFGWNDHWSSFGTEDKQMARYYELFSVVPKASNLRTVQMLNFFLFRFQFKTSHYPNRVSPDDFYKNLSGFIKQSKANGITPVILTAPSSHVRGKEPMHLWERHLQNIADLVPLHEQYVELARKAAKDNDALLIDLYKDFRQFPQETLEKRYFQSDGIHLQEEGDAIIAQKVLDAMMQSELIQTGSH